VQLNEGLRTIDRWAFQRCASLRSIIMPSTLKSIAFNAFDGCTNLVNVHLNEGLKNIGQDAFKNCTSLERVIIASTVNVIGYNAFNGCHVSR